ncbi:MAG TPA: GNAT family N-acetyltransferase [Gemmataceae bacterium]|nr:GNAT family N-acetyltransferase [Gemmataceae bacterium]
MTAAPPIADVQQLSCRDARAMRGGLIELLRDAVNSGASVGFLEPLSDDEAARYWDGVIAEVESGTRHLFAVVENQQVLGSVQFAIPEKPNARHRAAVEKLLVHTSARRQGLGTLLLTAAENAAIQLGRTLLVLDTRAGDPAGKLYEKLGYIRIGVIPGYALSPTGRPQAGAFYYRDLRDSDPHMLGESDRPLRNFG